MERCYTPIRAGAVVSVQLLYRVQIEAFTSKRIGCNNIAQPVITEPRCIGTFVDVCRREHWRGDRA